MDLTDIGIVAILILLIVHLMVGHRKSRPVVNNQFPSPMKEHGMAMRRIRSAFKHDETRAENAALKIEVGELKKKLDTMTTSREWLRDDCSRLQGQVSSIRKTLG